MVFRLPILLLILSLCTASGCRFLKSTSTPTIKSDALYKQTKLITVNPVTGRINYKSEAVFDIELKVTVKISANGLIDVELSKIEANNNAYKKLHVIAEQKKTNTYKKSIDIVVSIVHTGSFHPLSAKCMKDDCKPLPNETADTKKQTEGHKITFDFQFDKYPHLKPSSGIALQMGPPAYQEFPDTTVKEQK